MNSSNAKPRRRRRVAPLNRFAGVRRAYAEGLSSAINRHGSLLAVRAATPIVVEATANPLQTR